LKEKQMLLDADISLIGSLIPYGTAISQEYDGQ
jgi:hypothetical protein